jgi:ribosome biogenesis ATPase
VFLDELDAITPKRDSGAKGMERRVVAQLLTCLDALATRPNASPSADSNGQASNGQATNGQARARAGAAAAGSFTGYARGSAGAGGAGEASGESGVAAAEGAAPEAATAAAAPGEEGPSAAAAAAAPMMRRNPVLVVGATCRPDAVDGALRRAGRFDREVGDNTVRMHSHY